MGRWRRSLRLFWSEVVANSVVGNVVDTCRFFLCVVWEICCFYKEH